MTSGKHMKPISPAAVLRKYAGGLALGRFAHGDWVGDKGYRPCWLQIEPNETPGHRLHLCGHAIGPLMERDKALAVLSWWRGLAKEE